MSLFTDHLGVDGDVAPGVVAAYVVEHEGRLQPARAKIRSVSRELVSAFANDPSENPFDEAVNDFTVGLMRCLAGDREYGVAVDSSIARTGTSVTCSVLSHVRSDDGLRAGAGPAMDRVVRRLQSLVADADTPSYEIPALLAHVEAALCAEDVPEGDNRRECAAVLLGAVRHDVHAEPAAFGPVHQYVEAVLAAMVGEEVDVLPPDPSLSEYALEFVILYLLQVSALGVLVEGAGATTVSIMANALYEYLPERARVRIDERLETGFPGLDEISTFYFDTDYEWIDEAFDIVD